MKWMLIVIVFGATPVKTNLFFDNIDECLKAEEAMRTASARAFNLWLSWAKQNPSEAGYPDSQRLAMKRTGMENQGTCVPHASDER